MIMNGEQFARLRASLKWTQGETAAFLGLHRVHISRMEHNVKGISRSAAIAMLYHAPITPESEKLLERYTKHF